MQRRIYSLSEYTFNDLETIKSCWIRERLLASDNGATNVFSADARFTPTVALK